MEPRAAGLRLAAWLAAAVLAAAACGDASDGGDAGDEPAAPSGCADVVEAEAVATGDGTYSFSATVRSADTGWDKYADAWQVLGPDGEVLGTRELLHPHVDEQPFTRSLAGVEVPGDVAEVTVRARDSVAGWCGAEVQVAVAR